MLKKFLFIILAGWIFFGCGDDEVIQPPAQRIRKERTIQKPEEIEETIHKYTGAKYRSPFLPAGVAREMARIDTPVGDIPAISPEGLRVTGYFSDKKERYAILSGAGEFYIIKQGRLYDENENEVPGIAAIIKEDKIILITDKDTMYELPVPE